ncbi:MAG: nitrous oxide-stimulated promoter family protein [Euryarchaeota archaeon]|nr:nitrous oxide-stimulated promoter family protein [Euryarchaeota archaeon]
MARPMAGPGPRIRRERLTLEAMIRLFCRKRHHTRGALCEGCRALQEYALARLERCPFQERKPTCAKCRVHCYREPRRSQIREVMRFSGPRMLLRHPILAIGHLRDGRRPAP